MRDRVSLRDDEIEYLGIGDIHLQFETYLKATIKP